MGQSNKKLSWKEIKEKYPNEWVELVDFDEDEHGYVINGVVICHNKDKKVFTKESIKARDEGDYDIAAYLYTGEPAPLRTWEINN